MLPSMILGFLLAICFNPYIYTAATTPRFSFLAIAIPISIWFSSPNHFTPLHLIGLTLTGWLTLSLAWTAFPLDGLAELIQLGIVAGAFVLGARQPLKPIFAGLALGISVSSLIVVFPNIMTSYYVSVNWEGLFGNRNVLSECALLTLVGCFVYRLYWFIPGLVPAILYPPAIERASAIAFIMACGAWLWSYSRIAASVCGILAVVGALIAASLSNYPPSATAELVQIWTDTIKGITLFGHGFGSFYGEYPYFTESIDIALLRPEHAHNDILEIAFEVGIIGAILYCGFAASAFGMANSVQRPILAAFFTYGMFAFPWHVPVTAFIGAIVLGNVAGSGNSLRYWLLRIRLAIRARDIKQTSTRAYCGFKIGGQSSAV